ncbi:molybdopterin adenylyltransferase [Lachnoanaerobaculum sp. OBRC5-5]|uniref:molybdopterin adenylyltransferase n=1 Tax=Lachnoanaerobaculum sp. OBRC5-5 TaxID=936595 RepID=UPI0002825269|nr:molybdopterin adenylyltransferase [Lachnoanaerobaculum sp. OBRC5-5]EJZ69026.1 molybdenum cofactor synthesis domain-containing protein [Lachnoanaerobaculum sp. OBRC5-5]
MENNIEVLAVCISEKKGTEKKEVEKIVLKEDWGIEGDAHAGKWHRQVSLLAFEKIDAFRKKGAEVDFGAFGENIIVSGVDLRSLPVGTILEIGEARLRVTQIGKECHSHCNIYKKMGDCIMPREGIFAEVLKGGVVQKGESIKVIEKEEGPYRVGIITVSDRASKGEYEDKSGPVIKELVEAAGMEVVDYIIVPDEKSQIAKKLLHFSDQRQVDLVFTTGGTGFSKRDVTPEATKQVVEREVPGIGEALRSYSLTITPKAMLSRQTAGIRGNTLIINLPGSPKACKENIEYILTPLKHGLGILSGRETN